MGQITETKFAELRAVQAQLATFQDAENNRVKHLNEALAKQDQLETALRGAMRNPNSPWSAVEDLLTQIDTNSRQVANLTDGEDPVARVQAAALTADIEDRLRALLSTEVNA